MFNLVKTTTDDSLILRGLFLPGDINKPLMIHIHGFEGDFYSNEFVSVIANTLQKNNIGFLSVQTRGIGSETLIKTVQNTWRKYGSHFELLEEAYKDIDAWIAFAKAQGYTSIILQGHSMGTMKIVRYLFEGSYKDSVKKLILLAPFDIIQLLEQATNGKWEEYLKLATQRVAEGKGEEIIPEEFLDVAISYKTYVSHHLQNDLTSMYAFHRKGYDFPILQKITISVLAIAGTNDEFLHPANPSHPEEAFKKMKKHIRSFSSLMIPDAPHSFEGYEETMAKRILSFIE